MKRRRRPPNRLGTHTQALHVLISGAVCLVAFLFQESLLVRAAQVALFGLLAYLSGKRIRWVYFVVMFTSITLFNLVTPVGAVIFSIGRFPVTLGALEQGLLKGLAITGMVFISLFSVRSDLHLPGSFGGLVPRVFVYFERIFERRSRVSASNLIGSLDTILLDLFPGEQVVVSSGETGRTTLPGYVLLSSIAVVNVVLAALY